MQPPGRCLAAHVGQLPCSHGRQEPCEGLLPFPIEGLSGAERVPAERERHQLVLLASSTIFAVHDLRLVRMKFQSDLNQPTTYCVPHIAGLAFSHTVDHHIVREPFELNARELPSHPEVKAVMKENVGDQRGDRTPLWGALYPGGHGSL